MKVNIGVGNNITTDMIDNPEHAELTDELYRRNSKDKLLNGNDYNALMVQLDDKFSGDYNDLENAPILMLLIVPIYFILLEILSN